MGGDVLGGLRLAQQLGGGATDSFAGVLSYLHRAGRIEQERGSVTETLSRSEDIELSGKDMGWIGEHRETNLPNGRRGGVPCFVGEVRVGGDGVYLDPECLESFVLFGEVSQFGRADKREVSRVEEEYAPLAEQVFMRNIEETSITEGLDVEWLDGVVDDGHYVFSCKWVLRAGMARGDDRGWAVMWYQQARDGSSSSGSRPNLDKDRRAAAAH